MLHAVGEAHEVERHLDALAPLAPRERREQQRQLDVLERVEHRHQVVELEDEADVRARQSASSASESLRDVLAVDQQLARIGLVDAGDEVEQRRLARSRGPHERDEVALGDGERDVEEHRHVLAAAPVALGEMRDLDDGARGRPGRGAHFLRSTTVAPSASFSGGESATLSPAFAPEISTRSPSLRATA